MTSAASGFLCDAQVAKGLDRAVSRGWIVKSKWVDVARTGCSSVACNDTFGGSRKASKRDICADFSKWHINHQKCTD